MKLKLSSLKVNLIDSVDDEEFAADMLARHHYRGAKGLSGEYLKYVVTEHGYWVAVLYYEQTCRYSRSRESRIGWSRERLEERRKYVVNNSRFMILPEYQGVKNLASKVLSLVEKRLSKDYQKHYGHPVFIVESYVDPEAGFVGSCYKAAGYEDIGYTAGYNQRDGSKTSKKLHFMKPLHKEAYLALSGDYPHPLLTGVKPLEGSGNSFVLDANSLDFSSLREALSKIPDPRTASGQRYEFVPIMTLCIAATLCGYTQYRQMRDWIRSLPSELRAKVGLRGDRTPSETMISRLLRRVDAELLDEVVSSWLLSQSESITGRVLSLDGKHVRGTGGSTNKQKKFLQVIVQDLGIVIRQEEIENMHEGKAARRAVKGLKLDKNLITADAMHTQVKTAQDIEKKTAHFSSLSRRITQI